MEILSDWKRGKMAQKLNSIRVFHESGKLHFPYKLKNGMFML
jgi:hypothetical protein